MNENDTISVTELMFTDNDELSGLIASMEDSEALILLSNIDGIYDGSPELPESKVIREITSKSKTAERGHFNQQIEFRSWRNVNQIPHSKKKLQKVELTFTLATE